MQLSKVNPEDQSFRSHTASVIAVAKMDNNRISTVNMQKSTSVSTFESCGTSEDFSAYASSDKNDELLPTSRLKKSQSLANMLEKKTHYALGNVMEESSNDHSLNKNICLSDYSAGSSARLPNENTDIPVDSKLFVSATTKQDCVCPVDISISRPYNNHFDVISASNHIDFRQTSSSLQPAIARPQSLNFEMNDADNLDPEFFGPRSKSSENFQSVSGRNSEHSNGNEMVYSEVGLLSELSSPDECVQNLGGKKAEEEENNSKFWIETFECSSRSNDDYQHEHPSSSSGVNAKVDFVTKDMSTTGKHETADLCHLEETCEQVHCSGLETVGQHLNSINSKDSNTRRIEDWINQLDLHSDMIVEESEECLDSAPKVHPQLSSSARPDSKMPYGMEMAYNYIANLNAASSSAQLRNLGLFAIPILSAFVGLRALNLSGNSIVRITAGSLPKGLQVLNLSKNSISTIEGLRELIRLRALDLSYNKIAKIGHGLSSCSSLKELYLAGNKISEIDGLHRLLKLQILDLRFNKFLTSKCLGQLAANYNSLQVINVEGNPAQRNVGDEQLKKYLLSLLPRLVYYNKQATKARNVKDAPDHHGRSISSRCGTTDRGKKAIPKRPGTGAAAAVPKPKPSSAARHGRNSHSLWKESESRSRSSRPQSAPIRRIQSEKLSLSEASVAIISFK